MVETDRIRRKEQLYTPKTFTEKKELSFKKENYGCIGLDTDWGKVPGEFKILGREEGTFQFNKTIVDSTWDMAGFYKPNIAFYEDAPEGERALERTVEYIHQKHPQIAVIGDIKRADIGNTNEGYVRSAFDRFKFDAATVNPYFGAEALKPFLEIKDKGIIVLCRTSNPGAGEVQDLPVPIDKVANSRAEMMDLMEITGSTHIPFYLAIAHKAARYWNKNGNISLVVGATYPRELDLVRQVAPDVTILIPAIGAQQGDLQGSVAAGMDDNKSGIILNSSRGIIFANRRDEETVGEAARREAKKLREDINSFRHNPEGLTKIQQELADTLLKEGAIKFGAFKLKLHEKDPSAPLSPFYIDLRILRSSIPEVKKLVCQNYLDLTKDLQFDLLADVPTAITPFVAQLSEMTGVPMITPRGDKTYGSGAQIDGNYKVGQTALMIDDIITKGESKIGPAELLRSNGLNVKDVVVLIDREQGGRQDLASHGLRLISATTITNLLRYYKRTEQIDQSTYNEVTDYIYKYQ